ncbi:MAG: cell wall metabolism sensor histidine kinase WalK [Firmicutes bacterium]|nr:cell wall metabolism sensor histidine kinase WalK [Bacillota bacterium]NLM23979.1 cell wall metabolism sensor histidine kinase WalK [Bacillota bacterium]
MSGRRSKKTGAHRGDRPWEGLKQSALPHIWVRYFKVDKKNKRPLIGTGLGLSIVKKVVEMHAGRYGVESEEGVGSIFCLK